MATNGVSIKVKGTGRIQKPKLDMGPMTKIGQAMVDAQKKRWAFAVNSDGVAAKPLTRWMVNVKKKVLGQGNPVRDMRLTGKFLDNFQLRKAIDNMIRAEATTRAERQKATNCQLYDDMIGFAPTDQIAVFRAADEAYGKWLQKAWVQIR